LWVLEVFLALPMVVGVSGNLQGAFGSSSIGFVRSNWWWVLVGCGKLWFVWSNLMPPLKPSKFKFKYLYSSRNYSNGTSLLTSDMASGIKGGVNFMHQLATLKGT